MSFSDDLKVIWFVWCCPPIPSIWVQCFHLWELHPISLIVCTIIFYIPYSFYLSPHPPFPRWQNQSPRCFNQSPTKPPRLHPFSSPHTSFSTTCSFVPSIFHISNVSYSNTIVLFVLLFNTVKFIIQITVKTSVKSFAIQENLVFIFFSKKGYLIQTCVIHKEK